MIIIALIPLGIIYLMLSVYFLSQKFEWWTLPLSFILGYLAYASFAGAWLILGA